MSTQTLEMEDAQLNPRGSAGNGTQRSIVTLLGQFSIETRYPAAFFIDVFSSVATECERSETHLRGSSPVASS